MSRVRSKTSKKSNLGSKPTKRRRLKSVSEVKRELKLPIIESDPHYERELNSYRPEYAQMCLIMCSDGKTDFELSSLFGVRPQVIQHWIMLYPQFRKGYKVGSRTADSRVERALYSRAVGYHYDLVTYGEDDETGEVVVKSKKTIYKPADQRAIEFWLVNRLSDQWKTKQSADEDQLRPVIYQIDPQKLKGMNITDLKVLRSALQSMQQIEHQDPEHAQEQDVTDLDAKLLKFEESL